MASSWELNKGIERVDISEKKSKKWYKLDAVKREIEKNSRLNKLLGDLGIDTDDSVLSKLSKINAELTKEANKTRVITKK